MKMSAMLSSEGDWKTIEKTIEREIRVRKSDIREGESGEPEIEKQAQERQRKERERFAFGIRILPKII